jgi:hypothetical protein
MTKHHHIKPTRRNVLPPHRLREYLRGNKLCATVWNSYEAIVEACADAWNWFVNDPDRIRSIGTRGWATVNV